VVHELVTFQEFFEASHDSIYGYGLPDGPRIDCSDCSSTQSDIEVPAACVLGIALPQVVVLPRVNQSRNQEIESDAEVRFQHHDYGSAVIAAQGSLVDNFLGILQLARWIPIPTRPSCTAGAQGR
jgi:hypothetical protein